MSPVTRRRRFRVYLYETACHCIELKARSEEDACRKARAIWEDRDTGPFEHLSSSFEECSAYEQWEVRP